MARLRGGSVMLRLARKMLMKIVTGPMLNHAAATAPADAYNENYEDLSPLSKELPADVKEGHFVVLAMNESVPKRFIVELDYLAHPAFLKLLELAEEEFGFKQVGVLAIPCRSIELQSIIGNSQ